VETLGKYAQTVITEMNQLQTEESYFCDLHILLSEIESNIASELDLQN